MPLVRCLHQTWISEGGSGGSQRILRATTSYGSQPDRKRLLLASRENTELVIEGAFEDLVIGPSVESESFKFQPFTRFLVTMLSSFTCQHSRTSNGESFWMVPRGQRRRVWKALNVVARRTAIRTKVDSTSHQIALIIASYEQRLPVS